MKIHWALALALTACVDDYELSPPPHQVYRGDLPEKDWAHAQAAIDAWNEVVGEKVLVARDEARGSGECGVELRIWQGGRHPLGSTELGGCVIVVRYLAGVAECVMAHELGHVQGLLDVPQTTSVMCGRGCDHSPPTAEDGALVRARWGW